MASSTGSPKPSSREGTRHKTQDDRDLQIGVLEPRREVHALLYGELSRERAQCSSSYGAGAPGSTRWANASRSSVSARTRTSWFLWGRF
jgi:hypothetical protein